VDATRPLPADTADLLGGRYRLGLRIGSGATAEVFRAHDVKLARAVAIKLYHLHTLTPDDEQRRRDEVEILANLNHPGLVTVFDAGLDDCVPADPRSFVAMELVEGETLARAISRGPVAGEEVAAVAAQVCEALVHIHSQGVVHRDIKPANILLAQNDVRRTQAKLTDFGIARRVDATHITAVGSTIGTANYLSPEQVTGQKVTPASDMYSLGLVLLECLTGNQAYPGRGIDAAAARLDHDPYIPPRVGAAWSQLLTALTHRSPDQRPDAAATLVALRGLIGVTTAADEDTEPFGALDRISWSTGPAHAKTASHRRFGGRALAAAVGASAAAVLAFTLAAAPGPPNSGPAWTPTSSTTQTPQADNVDGPTASTQATYVSHDVTLAASNAPHTAVPSPASVTGQAKSRGNGRKKP